MKKTFAMFFAAVSLTMLVFAAQSEAAIIYDYSAVVSGYAPAGSPPWATLTIEDYAANQVKLTLQANLQGPEEFISGLWLNIAPFVSDVSLVSGSVVGGASVSIGKLDENRVSGLDEQFDLRIEFETANNPDRLTDHETVSWILQGTGLTENHFLAKSVKLQGKKTLPGTFYTMIHVQGIPLGPNGPEGSGKLTASVIPEPGTILLFAAGLAAPLMSRLRRRT